MSIVTTARAGSAGTAGAPAGFVPLVITSGSYTHSFPVTGSRIVAWTKAPRFAALAIVQPKAAGAAPPGPVSWYGVASPAAVSGCAGTMSSQFAFAGGGGPDSVGDGHGAVVAGAVVAGAALWLVAGAAGAGAAVEAPAAVGGGTALPLVALAASRP